MGDRLLRSCTPYGAYELILRSCRIFFGRVWMSELGASRTFRCTVSLPALFAYDLHLVLVNKDRALLDLATI